MKVETTLPLQKEARIIQFTKDESLASFQWCSLRIAHNYPLQLSLCYSMGILLFFSISCHFSCYLMGTLFFFQFFFFNFSCRSLRILIFFLFFVNFPCYSVGLLAFSIFLINFPCYNEFQHSGLMNRQTDGWTERFLLCSTGLHPLPGRYPAPPQLQPQTT